MASKGVEVVIPDICMGELMHVVVDKKLQVDFEDLAKELRRGRLRVGHVKKDDLMHYSNLVPKIRKADALLESSDVRILAMSMVDRTATAC